MYLIHTFDLRPDETRRAKTRQLEADAYLATLVDQALPRRRFFAARKLRRTRSRLDDHPVRPVR